MASPGSPTFLSLFSGAGGLDLGLHRAGWECVGQCEADAYRRGVLARHWPDVTQWDDVAALDPADVPGPVDLIAGGFPCQDVSVAGRRAGLAGKRTGLFWEALRLVDAIRPRFVLLENVPGLLTSNGGRDFGVVLGALADVGYGVGWRVVDSRFFGVPQRRRRVFIVGARPGGRAGAERAAAILAVGSRCAGHPPAGGGPREGAPPGAGGGATGTLTRGYGEQAGQDLGAVGLVSTPSRTAGTLVRRMGKGVNGAGDDDAFVIASTLQAPKDRGWRIDAEAAAGGHLVPTVAHTLRAEGFDASEDGTGRGTPLTVYNPTRSFAADGEVDTTWQEKHVANALFASGHENKKPVAVDGAGVRRLTTVECCRLQGFPDDWFGEPNAKPDGPRYAALGDAVTVNVAEWIGARLLDAVDHQVS